MNGYKLSVIVPTFNLENVISETFDSIKNQTIGFENIELIFIDDCSSDNTYKILTNYSETYDNVTVLKTDTNTGFAGAPRNLGLKKSNAEYVLFLDGDDQLLVDACEILYKNITSSNADIVIGGHINKYENKRLEHIPPLYFGRTETFTDVINPNLFKIIPAIGAKIFKKEMLTSNDILFPEGISGEDLVFLLNSIINSNKIAVLNNFYVYYRNIKNDSVTFHLTENYFYGLIKAYSLICDLFENHDIPYNLQEMVLTGHLGFFSRQILRAFYATYFKNETLYDILNSEPFNRLSGKKIFRKNIIFDEFFRNMKTGYYNNQPLLKMITDKYDPELKEEYNYLKNYTDILKEENTKLNNEKNNIETELKSLESTNTQLNTEINNLKEELKDANKKLSEISNENNNLKNELTKIKSSKLWKLKNRL